MIQSSATAYPCILIPKDELQGSTSVTATLLKLTNGEIINNSFYLRPVDSAFNEGSFTGGTIGSSITIPTIANDGYLQIECAFGWNTGTATMILKLVLS